MKPKRLARGLWRWTARHPEWHPGEFGREVASFALQTGDDTLLIDPLLPPEPEPVLELIEGTLRDRLTILITIPYHVRSSEDLRRRFQRHVKTTIRGHALCAKRLSAQTGFKPLEAGDELPAGVSAHAIGRPRRSELPLYLPSHRALAFGDAVVERGGKLYVWSYGRPLDARVERFFRERFNPTLKPLLELDVERVLVTHGEPVLRDGRRELRAALRRKPWQHR